MDIVILVILVVICILTLVIYIVTTYISVKSMKEEFDRHPFLLIDCDLRDLNIKIADISSKIDYIKSKQAKSAQVLKDAEDLINDCKDPKQKALLEQEYDYFNKACSASTTNNNINLAKLQKMYSQIQDEIDLLKTHRKAMVRMSDANKLDEFIIDDLAIHDMGIKVQRILDESQAMIDLETALPDAAEELAQKYKS